MKWEDWKGGQRSEIHVDWTPAKGVSVAVWQPDTSVARDRHRNWETRIAMCSAGASLSLASGKIDSIMALQRDIEKLAEALGGKVVWKDIVV